MKSRRPMMSQTSIWREYSFSAIGPSSTTFLLTIVPTVRRYFSSNWENTYLRMRDVFPTPSSPMRQIFILTLFTGRSGIGGPTGGKPAGRTLTFPSDSARGDSRPSRGRGRDRRLRRPSLGRRSLRRRGDRAVPGRGVHLLELRLRLLPAAHRDDRED